MKGKVDLRGFEAAYRNVDKKGLKGDDLPLFNSIEELWAQNQNMIARIVSLKEEAREKEHDFEKKLGEILA